MAGSYEQPTRGAVAEFFRIYLREYLLSNEHRQKAVVQMMGVLLLTKDRISGMLYGSGAVDALL